MNAERLHAIAIAIKEELRATDQVALVGQMTDALRLSLTEPAQENHQVQVAQARARLNEVLPTARSNSFSPAWREAADELGVSELLGDQLLERIEGIFVRDALTPAAAADALEGLAEELRRLDHGLNALLEGLGFFDVRAEELDPGDFEVGVLIPRRAVRNQLGKLGKEFEEIEELLAPILELATGTVPEVNVRAISSSDFQVFLDAVPQVAMVVIDILDALANTFVKIRRLREMYGELIEAGEPEEVTAPMQARANGILDIDAQAIAESLVEKYGEALRGQGRGHEVTMKVSRSIKEIAGRIDDEFRFEVRSYVIDDEEGEGDEEGDAPELPEGATRETEEARRYVIERQAGIDLKLTGPPILKELTEGGEPVGQEPDDTGDADPADEEE